MAVGGVVIALDRDKCRHITADLGRFPAYVARQWRIPSKNPTEGLIRWKLNPAQRRVELAIAHIPRKMPIRIAVLKYRQCGMSTYACGKMQHGCMYHPGVVGLTIADKLDLPEQWLRRGRMWLDQIRPKFLIPHIQASNFREMWFDKIGSRYFISSAEAKTPGVGATLHLFHGSECALWLHPGEIERQTWQGIPTVGGSMVLLESTGEALGDWWWRLWTDAKAGRNDFEAIFLSWLIQDEYRMPADDILDLTKAEQELVALGADREQIAWRRWKIRNDLGGSEDSFANQFPHTPGDILMARGPHRKVSPRREPSDSNPGFPQRSCLKG